MKIYFANWQPFQYGMTKVPALTAEVVNRVIPDQISLFNQTGYMIIHNTNEGGAGFDSNTTHEVGCGKYWLQYFATLEEFNAEAARQSGSGRIFGTYRRLV